MCWGLGADFESERKSAAPKPLDGRSLWFAAVIFTHLLGLLVPPVAAWPCCFRPQPVCWQSSAAFSGSNASGLGSTAGHPVRISRLSCQCRTAAHCITRCVRVYVVNISNVYQCCCGGVGCERHTKVQRWLLIPTVKQCMAWRPCCWEARQVVCCACRQAASALACVFRGE